MSDEQTRKNKKSVTNDTRNLGSNKERAAKPPDAGPSRHNPNQAHDQEKISKADYNQPIGEFSDWNKQRS
jgi:hypothetical protein